MEADTTQTLLFYARTFIIFINLGISCRIALFTHKGVPVQLRVAFTITAICIWYAAIERIAGIMKYHNYVYDSPGSVVTIFGFTCAMFVADSVLRKNYLRKKFTND